MSLTKVLITVKTYPTLSEKYDELVCTAGFREDGTWVRIFPVPFRKLNFQNQYEKWQWIEIDLVKNMSDFRPESYRPTDLDREIRILDKVDTKSEWGKRKLLIGDKIWNNMTELIANAKDSKIRTSLAIVKPKEIIDFVCVPCDREWNKQKMDKVIANNAQGSLFDEAETRMVFKVVKKLPYDFFYIFTTEDGKKRNIMIEDWELGMLYWNCLKGANGDETIACQKVKEKYFDDMYKKRDLYFFMGTIKQFHNVAPNPFIIVGTFYPPKSDTQQMKLF
ncbi:MAG: hypothetical protein JXR27_04180 [Paludibacteraceae bacterium]|nr:hypothetical protein [Paludibacteraceae bacterium]